ncbi:MAG: ABC-F family ATP-binding cassette domain-containing protein [Planctomycetes bacterium]|jgi:ATP-binding cassette subfamily F protein 3|nr:ABC-F family ATP-binding cassette domain-containing protein [Planctomycetota bacterium]MCL4728818.1 ATP-binding cassette domain-containing protein [Planctomycetota bacterium]
MALVTIDGVSVHFGGPTLLNAVTLDIEPGHKIGLIGQNGTGKSTLLKLIVGEAEPTDGRIIRQRGLNVAYQAQELRYEPGATAFEEMRRVFTQDLQRQQRMHEIEEALATAPATERPALLAHYEKLQAEHDARSGYDVDRRIETVLTGLGLPEKAWSQPIASFSGGERNIIGLARIVLQEPELMLLDEPSNHLDMEGIEWFIGFLRQTRAAVVMVSHNRHLLDATVDNIWELHGRKITSWTGNYSDFARQKQEALALQERQYKAQQRLIKRIQFQARRLLDMARAYDDPGQAKRAKAMLMRIEQMDKVEAPDTTEHRFHANLSGASRHGHIALEVAGVTIEVGGVKDAQSPTSGLQSRTLLDSANLEIHFGQRVALVGPNGSGKTTLFNAILRHASWDNPDVDVQEGPFHIRGRLRVGKSAKVGDYSQIHDHRLPHNETLITWLMNVTGLRFEPAAALLHRFLFSRDDLERPIGTLSGGEKSRLQLARLVHEKVSFLMLDEPTNHLDIQACEQLEEMLEDYEGTLLVISHDRYFLDKLVNRVVELKDRKLVVHEGSFADWWQQRHQQAVEGRKGALQLHSQAQAHEQSAGAAAREAQKARQREQHKLRTQLKAIEGKIERLEARQKELEAKLAEAFSAQGTQSAKEAARIHAEFESVRGEIAGLTREWEALAESVDG